MIDTIADFIDKLRIFPRIALAIMLWMGVDAYLWTKGNINADDIQWFGNIVIGTIIAGLFAYMNTGRQR